MVRSLKVQVGNIFKKLKLMEDLRQMEMGEKEKERERGNKGKLRKPWKRVQEWEVVT